MVISDLIITKPGPGTINEAIAMHLPILVDNIDASLFWERANTEMVVAYGIGKKIKDYKQMKTILKDYLKDSTLQKEIAQSFVQLPSNQFHVRIGEIIDSMVGLYPNGLVNQKFQQEVSEQGCAKQVAIRPLSKLNFSRTTGKVISTMDEP
jgi:hypothetical protein